VAIPSLRGNEYSHCSSPCIQNILFVGTERGDEFSHPLRLVRQGHDVIAVNPRETSAARMFRQTGGNFLRGRIEDLPPESCGLDLICENYPFPSGRHSLPPRTFALSRLSRGRWILVTQSPRSASLLKAVGDSDNMRERFASTLSRLTIDEAPPSSYPRAETRFRLVLQRRR
jgi:hypothetical protein